MFRVARHGAGDEPPAVLSRLQRWRAKRRMRQAYRALMRCGDRQLEDLGLSRHEIRRRLWRDGPLSPADGGTFVDERPLAWLAPAAGDPRRRIKAA